MIFKRYALFYTPPSSMFAVLGSAWLGWDSARGKAFAPPEMPGCDVAALTATPRNYGFHATLKAPFHLAQDQTVAELRDVLDSFATEHPVVPLGPLAISLDHGFVAVRPTSPSPQLNDLAASVVRNFDRFRAPLSADDMARRRKSRLTERQDQQLVDWGYPFVFDDFNFHMTLTGRLSPDVADHVLPQIEAMFAPALSQTRKVDAVTLMGQDPEGRFHQIHRAPLTG